MAFWPFKRRKRSTADSKRPVRDLESSSLRRSPSPSPSPPRHRGFLGRKPSRRSQHDRAMAYSHAGPSDYRDSPMTEDHSFQHQDRSSPYLADQGRSGASSPASSNRPHKQSSFIRKLSLRRKDKGKALPPPSAYESHITRRNTKTSRSRYLPGRENDRSLSPGSTAPRTSMESQLSSRAYKIRTLDVFSPHPTLHYDDESSPTSDRSRHRGASLTPTRTNSRRTASRATQEWRYRGPLVSVENLSNHRSRVDDLVDELDAKAISEAMERDRRRREKKKKEYEERLRLKLERRALQQQQGLESEPHHHHHHHPRQEQPHYRNNAGESSTADQRDPRIGHAVSGTQTPLSWFNDDPSVEDVSKGLRQFPPRPDVVTPVSMDSPDERAEDLSAAEEVPAIVVDGSSPPRGKAKASGWASFIKRATTTRLKKEHSTHSIRMGQSTLLSDSEGEEFGNVQQQQQQHQHQQHQQHQHQPEAADAKANYLEVDDLRHREGQTPGRHVSSEVVLAMNALETGHIQDSGCQEDEYKDEMRDSVLPTSRLAPYHHHNGSQTSSRSSLVPPNLGLRGGGATPSKSHSPMDDSRDSPTLPSHHPARYSPSMKRRSSGAASPENGARSVMSTSLASIDSEGSWLSGKINQPRVSVQQINPLRTSASSLRKRYNEMDDHDGTMDDDYFTGVRKPASNSSRNKRINSNSNNSNNNNNKESSADEEDIGGARLDLDDTDEDDDMDDNVSLNSEAERNMWREGMEKRVELRNGMRAKSREGMLDDFDDEPYLIDSPADNRSTSPQLQPDEFATPQEQPSFSGTASTMSEFRTPLEHPALRMEYHAM